MPKVRERDSVLRSPEHGRHFSIVLSAKEAIIMAPSFEGGHSSILKLETILFDSDPLQPAIGDMADVLCQHLNGQG